MNPYNCPHFTTNSTTNPKTSKVYEEPNWCALLDKPCSTPCEIWEDIKDEWEEDPNGEWVGAEDVAAIINETLMALDGPDWDFAIAKAKAILKGAL